MFSRILSLIPAILAAVQMVESLPHIQGSDNKKAAALALVQTGLTIGEDVAGKTLANHPAFTQVAGDAIDAIVAVGNLTKSPAPVATTTA